MIEEWKPVIGFEGWYDVSNIGRVRSVARQIIRSNGHPQAFKSRIIATSLSSSNYPQIHMHTAGKQTTKGLHVVIAEAWIPNPNNLPEVNHKDKDKNNSLPDNLEWVTRSKNSCHTIAHGTKRTTLSMTRARALRADTATHSTKQLAAKYSVSVGTVQKIKRNECWKEEKYAEFL